MTCKKYRTLRAAVSIIIVLIILTANSAAALGSKASAEDKAEIHFEKLRYAEETEEDGKNILSFYKKNAADGEMFVAKSNYILKSDTRYKVSLDYLCANGAIQPAMCSMNTDTAEGWNENGLSGYLLGYSTDRTAYSEWRSESFIIDTAGKVDEKYKYFSFAAKNVIAGADVSYKIANLKIEEIADDFEFTSFNAHFNYADDGTRKFAEYSCPNAYYVLIGFGVQINVEASEEYILSFDYKCSGSFKDNMTFKIGTEVIHSPKLEQTGEWKSYCARISVPFSISQSEMRFDASTNEGRAYIAFDNIRLMPINDGKIYPEYFKDMSEYVTDSGEYVWKFDTKAREYVLTGFVTDFELEADTAYEVRYEYRQTTSSWNAGNALFFGAANSLDITGFDSAFSNRIDSLGLESCDEWTQKASVIRTGNIDENSYLAVCGQTLGLPFFEFKNMTIRKISGAVTEPSDTVGLEKITEAGETVWKSASAASVAGLATGFKAESGIYTIAFDYKLTYSRQLSGEIAFCLTKSGDFSDTAGGQAIKTLIGDGKWRHTEIPYRISSVDDKDIISLSARLSAKKIKISLKNISVHRITETQDDPPQIFFNDDTRGIRYSAKENCDLVYDGGFENDEWFDITYADTVSIAEGGQKNGKKALKFSASALGSTAWSVKYYDVEPNCNYYLSLWVKGDIWSKNNRCDMTFGIVDVLTGKFVSSVSGEPQYTDDKQMVIPAWDNEWHFVNLAFNTGSANRIGIGFNGKNSTSYFDDISLFKESDKVRVYPYDQQRANMYLTDNMINDYTENSFEIDSDGSNSFLKLETVTKLNEYKILRFQTTYQLKPDCKYRVSFKFKDEQEIDKRKVFAEGLYAISGNGAHGAGAAYRDNFLSDAIPLNTSTDDWNTVSFTVDTSLCMPGTGEKIIDGKNKFLAFFLKAYELSSYSILFDDFEIENLSNESAENAVIDFETGSHTATCEDKDNLISNYNFSEIENDFWNGGLSYGYNVSVTDTGTKYGKALKFKSNDNITGYPLQTSYIKWIEVKPHTNYTFSANWQVLKSGNAYFAIIDGSYYYPRILTKVVFSDTPSGEWKCSTITFNSGGYERIGFIVTDRGGEAYLDNLRLFETENAKEVPNISVPEQITSSVYTADADKVFLIDGGKSLLDLKTEFDNTDYIKFRDNGTVIADESLTAFTGLEILLYDSGKVYDKAFLSVRFDTNGDGTADAADMVLLRKYLLGIGDFSRLQKKALQRAETDDIDIIDLILMKKYIVKKQ